jgi:hypothetical protein
VKKVKKVKMMMMMMKKSQMLKREIFPECFCDDSSLPALAAKVKENYYANGRFNAALALTTIALRVSRPRLTALRALRYGRGNNSLCVSGSDSDSDSNSSSGRNVGL